MLNQRRLLKIEERGRGEIRSPQLKGLKRPQEETVDKIVLKKFQKALDDKIYVQQKYLEALKDIEFDVQTREPERFMSDTQVLNDSILIRAEVQTILRNTKSLSEESLSKVMNELEGVESVFIYQNPELISSKFKGKRRLSDIEFLQKLRKLITLENESLLTKQDIKEIIDSYNLREYTNNQTLLFQRLEQLINQGVLSADEANKVVDNMNDEDEDNDDDGEGAGAAAEGIPLVEAQVLQPALESEKTYLNIKNGRLLELLYDSNGNPRAPIDPVFSMIGEQGAKEMKREFLYRYYKLSTRGKTPQVNFSKENNKIFREYITTNGGFQNALEDLDNRYPVRAGNGAKRGFGVRRGRGIMVHSRIPSHYKRFGDKVLNMKQLEKSMLNIKYPNKKGGTIQAVPGYPKRISDDLKSIIEYTVETGKINNHLINKLSDNDKEEFIKVMSKANFNEFKQMKHNRDKEKKERFELLKGQLMMDNNNRELKQEFKTILIEFMEDGLIKPKVGYDILEDLKL